MKSDLYAADKKNSEIYDPEKGYLKSPSAVELNESIKNDSIYVNGKIADGNLTYAMDKNSNIIIGDRINQKGGQTAPHPTLIGGKNPEVQCARMMKIKDGKIVSVDNMSGHFKPNIQSLDKIKNALKDFYTKHPNVFSTESEWRNN